MPELNPSKHAREQNIEHNLRSKGARESNSNGKGY